MADATVRWPPRSPHEALLSSPSGRKRLRQMHDLVSPSSSPRRNPTMTPTFRQRARQLVQADGATEDDGDDDDDEETLQLQLEAIQAKIKLNKLRKAKAKTAISSCDADVEVGTAPASTSIRKAEGAGRHDTGRGQAKDERGTILRTRSQPNVQVPLSPRQAPIVPQEQRSPGRVMLGIDKGWKGQDVSLRRAPSLRNDPKGANGSRQNSHSRTLRAAPGSNISARQNRALAGDPPKSFSERIAQSRVGEKDRKEKLDSLRSLRSKKFDVEPQEVKAYLSAAHDSHGDPFLAEAERNKPREFTRDEVLKSYTQTHNEQSKKQRNRSPNKSQGGHDASRAASTANTGTSCQSQAATSGRHTSPAPKRHRSASSEPITKDGPSPDSPRASSQFESFSSLHLSKRILPHNFLTRTFAGKDVLSIPDILKTVKSPDYDPPDVEGDWVAIGVIASKSTPKAHKDDHKQEAAKGDDSSSGRGKYMVITLTDLKWELDLFLFDTGFDRFWKLTPGTVIAILNPNIMPPPPSRRDTGRFSLTLTSSDDTVLEIGTARDLGFCKSIKKDGKPCSSWIDVRHTDYCTFHIDVSLHKTKAGRMEVNTLSAPFAPGGRASSRTGFFGTATSSSSSRGGKTNNKPTILPNGSRRDPASHANYFLAPSPFPNSLRPSAAALIDADMARGASSTPSEERLRKRLAERERERSIALQLGRVGGGMGGEYLRATAASSSAATDDHARPATSSGATTAGLTPHDLDEENPLGLAPLKASSVRLSPLKPRRSTKRKAVTESSSSSTTTTTTNTSSSTTPSSNATTNASQSFGWGIANKRGLLEGKHVGSNGTYKDGETAAATSTTTGPTLPEPSEHSLSNEPVRKKTRFVTARGIKEAGRESFGMGTTVEKGDGAEEEDDDDGGLEIV
ncbi:MAG: hypothetical protein M1833_002445 [Piccolia ochrophora]|nr:MAG: hypothetical protein M1833_002445 [Piccolia ochrophora]